MGAQWPLSWVPQKTEVKRICRKECWRTNCMERNLKSCKGCPLSIQLSTDQYRVQRKRPEAEAREEPPEAQQVTVQGIVSVPTSQPGNPMLHRARSRVLSLVMPHTGEQLSLDLNAALAPPEKSGPNSVKLFPSNLAISQKKLKKIYGNTEISSTLLTMWSKTHNV